LITRTFCFRQSTENYGAGEQLALFFLAFQFFVAFLLMTLPGFISPFKPAGLLCLGRLLRFSAL
jgi:hypothetical protein